MKSIIMSTCRIQCNATISAVRLTGSTSSTWQQRNLTSMFIPNPTPCTHVLLTWPTVYQYVTATSPWIIQVKRSCSLLRCITYISCVEPSRCTISMIMRKINNNGDLIVQQKRPVMPLLGHEYYEFVMGCMLINSWAPHSAVNPLCLIAWLWHYLFETNCCVT